MGGGGGVELMLHLTLAKFMSTVKCFFKSEVKQLLICFILKKSVIILFIIHMLVFKNQFYYLPNI